MLCTGTAAHPRRHARSRARRIASAGSAYRFDGRSYDELTPEERQAISGFKAPQVTGMAEADRAAEVVAAAGGPPPPQPKHPHGAVWRRDPPVRDAANTSSLRDDLTDGAGRRVNTVLLLRLARGWRRRPIQASASHRCTACSHQAPGRAPITTSLNNYNKSSGLTDLTGRTSRKAAPRPTSKMQ